MKYLWFVLTLLLAVQVMGADFLDDRTEYVYEIRRALGYDTASTVISTSDGISLVKQSVNRTCALLYAVKNDKVQTTTYQQSTYTLDTLCIKVLNVFISKNDSLFPLRYAPSWQWPSLVDQSTKSVGDLGPGNEMLQARLKRPRFYDYTDSKLYIFPVPTIPRGDTLHIICAEKVPNIDTATNLSVIPVKFRQLVLDYAVLRAAMQLQHPLLQFYQQNYDQTWKTLNETINIREGSTIEVTPDK